jgi:hypothetical protein
MPFTWPAQSIWPSLPLQRGAQGRRPQALQVLVLPGAAGAVGAAALTQNRRAVTTSSNCISQTRAADTLRTTPPGLVRGAAGAGLGERMHNSRGTSHPACEGMRLLVGMVLGSSARVRSQQDVADGAAGNHSCCQLPATVLGQVLGAAGEHRLHCCRLCCWWYAV